MEKNLQRVGLISYQNSLSTQGLQMKKFINLCFLNEIFFAHRWLDFLGEHTL